MIVFEPATSGRGRANPEIGAVLVGVFCASRSIVGESRLGHAPGSAGSSKPLVDLHRRTDQLHAGVRQQACARRRAHEEARHEVFEHRVPPHERSAAWHPTSGMIGAAEPDQPIAPRGTCRSCTIGDESSPCRASDAREVIASAGPGDRTCSRQVADMKAACALVMRRESQSPFRPCAMPRALPAQIASSSPCSSVGRIASSRVDVPVHAFESEWRSRSSHVQVLRESRATSGVRSCSSRARRAAPCLERGDVRLGKQAGRQAWPSSGEAWARASAVADPVRPPETRPSGSRREDRSASAPADGEGVNRSLACQRARARSWVMARAASPSKPLASVMRRRGEVAAVDGRHVGRREERFERPSCRYQL